MDIFGVNGGEFIVIALLALALLGPDRLPEYAASLARLIRRGRDFAMSARDQVRNEVGPEFDDVDWQKYDPRKYHPRAIVRNALADTFEDEDDKPKRPASATARAGTGKPAAGRSATPAQTPTSRPASGGDSTDDRSRGTSRPQIPTGTTTARAPRSPRPPAVRDTPRASPQPGTWSEAAKRAGVQRTGGFDDDAT